MVQADTQVKQFLATTATQNLKLRYNKLISKSRSHSPDSDFIKKALLQDNERVSRVIFLANSNPEMAYAAQNFERSIKRLLSIIKKPKLSKADIVTVFAALGMELKESDPINDKKKLLIDELWNSMSAEPVTRVPKEQVASTLKILLNPTLTITQQQALLSSVS